MIGVFDYTVILTYMSLITSVCGIFCACSGHIRWALACLAMSGLMDAFDGKIARTKKDRTDLEKAFGVQLDSLCDIVCFGVLPAVICYFLGMHTLAGMAILALYVLAGLIRLAWFNVTAETEAPRSDGKKYYQGMPITSIAAILPVFYAVGTLAPGVFLVGLPVIMLATAVLFVLRFRFRKPSNKELMLLIGFVALVILYILACHLWGVDTPWHWVLRLVRRK